MAFEGLSEKLNAVFKRLRGKGRISEADVKEAMREVRLALLEADVSYKVVKDFIASVTERAVGADVLESLTPAQQIIKIVNEELTALMGGANAKIALASQPPTVVMMVGLQGAGKTTNGAKLAGYFKKQMGKRPLLVACDVYRPAAITQLQVVGEQLDIPVFEMGQSGPGGDRPVLHRLRQGPRLRHGLPGHRRPAPHRREAHGRAEEHQDRRPSQRDSPGGGRHDRPGRRQRRHRL